jgi:hypothetical protein
MSERMAINEKATAAFDLRATIVILPDGDHLQKSGVSKLRAKTTN